MIPIIWHDIEHDMIIARMIIISVQYDFHKHSL